MVESRCVSSPRRPELRSASPDGGKRLARMILQVPKIIFCAGSRTRGAGQQGSESLLVEARHTKFFGLVELAPGIRSEDYIARLLGDARGDASPALFDGRL